MTTLSFKSIWQPNIFYSLLFWSSFSMQIFKTFPRIIHGGASKLLCAICNDSPNVASFGFMVSSSLSQTWEELREQQQVAQTGISIRPVLNQGYQKVLYQFKFHIKFTRQLLKKFTNGRKEMILEIYYSSSQQIQMF